MIFRKIGWMGLGLLWLVACQGRVEPGGVLAIPTLVPLAAIEDDVPVMTAAATVPPTWTPEIMVTEAIVVIAAANTSTPIPQATSPALPTNTPRPTFTPVPIPPTETPTLTPFVNILTPGATLPLATPVPPPASGPNLLPNPSFENGWYNLNGIPELQIPNEWTLEWDAGNNPLDPDPWNAFVRPESRVLPKDFLPPNEHSTFIWDGTHTVKIFKGEGAISFRLLTQRHLEPGQYRFEVNIFPDLVVGYDPSGAKIWAPDPLSGEVQFLVDGAYGGWRLPTFGRRNTLTHLFTVTEPHTITLGVWIRGRWAIENNGWFMDDWSLQQVAP